MKDFVERNLDLLQNLEFAIVTVYRSDPALTDYDAKDAVDALVRRYHSEEEGRTPPVKLLGERAEPVFESVERMCEWRLGRGPGPGEAAVVAEVPLADLVRALREIQKSIPRWTQRSGKRGYLDFVSEMLP